MSRATAIALAIVATAFLVIGAQLLDSTSTGVAALGFGAIGVGIAVGAGAIGAAWRSSSQSAAGSPAGPT